MKRILLSFMLLVSTITMFAYDFEVDGIYYNITSKEKLECEVTYKSWNDKSYSGIVSISSKVTYNSKEYMVTGIGTDAFFFSSDLTSIVIPNSVTTIGESAFKGCSGLTSINIPNSVTTIGGWAFEDCSGLTSINIPNSVTTIGNEAFFYCTGLTVINIPNSVTSIGYAPFCDCYGLTKITVDPSNKFYDSRDNCNAIIKKSTNSLIQGCQNTIIPNSVTIIDSLAFDNCKGLTSITIPNSVTTIEFAAFADCSGLTSVNIPNSVTFIGEHAFHSTGLKSITIPNSVTTIESYAFADCFGLTSVTNLAAIPQNIDSSTFSEYGTLHVYEGCKDVYANADYWKEFNIIDDIPQLSPCANPTITYENGKVSYNCETEGAECHTSLSCSGLSLSLQSDNTVVISGQFTISVYATAEGYLQSETATKTITLENIPIGESHNSDGAITINDITDLINRYLQQE